MLLYALHNVSPACSKQDGRIDSVHVLQGRSRNGRGTGCRRGDKYEVQYVMAKKGESRAGTSPRGGIRGGARAIWSVDAQTL